MPVATDRPLFVRLPAADAALLDRAAFENGVSKRELVTRMVRRYLDSERLTPPTDPPLTAVGGADLRVGRHSFRPDPAAEVLTLEQAAELLRTEPAVLADLAEKGEVPGRRVGGEWRFARAALLAWLGG